MATEVLVPLAVALIAGTPATLALRSAVRTKAELRERSAREDARTQIEQVYGQAYDRAQRINQEIVEGLRDEIHRLQKELTDVRTDMGRTAHRNVELERLVNSLERSVSRMSALLTQYGIDVPADPPPYHEGN